MHAGLRSEEVYEFWQDHQFKGKVFIKIINNLDETKRSKHGTVRVGCDTLAAVCVHASVPSQAALEQ